MIRTATVTIGALEDFWASSAGEWGMIGPVDYDPDEALLVVELGDGVYQILRNLDGDWYDCMDHSNLIEIEVGGRLMRLLGWWEADAHGIGITIRPFANEDFPPEVLEAMGCQ